MGCNTSLKGVRIASMLVGATILLNTTSTSNAVDSLNSKPVVTSLTMKRDLIQNDAVFGSLYVNGVFVCYTLENRDKMIPPGTYEVSHTTKGFRLHGVKGRSNINIEIGNYPFESLGCIFVGTGKTATGVTGSKIALIRLVRLVSLPASLTIS